MRKVTLVIIGLSLLGLPPSLFAQNRDPKSGGVTAAGVRDLLVGLGREPETVDAYQRVKLQSEELGTVFVDVALGGDETVLWMLTYLGDMKSQDSLAAGDLYKVLVATDAIGPSHFCIIGDRLYLRRGIDNRAITPKRLDDTLLAFAQTVQSSRAAWVTVTKS